MWTKPDVCDAIWNSSDGEKNGGLKDTVIDYGEPDGYGITFNYTSGRDITHAIYPGYSIITTDEKENEVQSGQTMMELDFSWEQQVQQEYI